MKIITNDKAYVQLNDLAVLMRFNEGKSIPSSVINSVFGEVFICTDANRYEFREFSRPEEIKFFRELDYSVEYFDYKDKTEEEFIVAGTSIAEEMNKIANEVNELVKSGKTAPQELYTKHQELEFKMLSIRDILWFKQGHLKIKLPNIEQIKQEEKGIKKILNIFKKR